MDHHLPGDGSELVVTAYSSTQMRTMPSVNVAEFLDHDSLSDFQNFWDVISIGQLYVLANFALKISSYQRSKWGALKQMVMIWYIFIHMIWYGVWKLGTPKCLRVYDQFTHRRRPGTAPVLDTSLHAAPLWDGSRMDPTNEIKSLHPFSRTPESTCTIHSIWIWQIHTITLLRVIPTMTCHDV